MTLYEKNIKDGLDINDMPIVVNVLSKDGTYIQTVNRLNKNALLIKYGDYEYLNGAVQLDLNGEDSFCILYLRKV